MCTIGDMVLAAFSTLNHWGGDSQSELFWGSLVDSYIITLAQEKCADEHNELLDGNLTFLVHSAYDVISRCVTTHAVL
jgi:hypothetical protein